MISLSDSELAAVMAAARPIPAHQRDQFLRDVAAVSRSMPKSALASSAASRAYAIKPGEDVGGIGGIWNHLCFGAIFRRLGQIGTVT